MISFLEKRVIVIQGDITDQKVDAVVNAANSSLMGGSGVDGAIHRKGGPTILDECIFLRKTKLKEGLPPGEAVRTGAGNLKARYIIHTVGPIYSGDPEDDIILSRAYSSSLKLAETSGCRSIAFPAISTGVYGFPRERAALIVSGTISDYINSGGRIESINLVFFSERDLEIFIKNQKFKE